MYLKKYVSDGGALFNNSYGIFDNNTLTARAVCLFGWRTMRDDYPTDEIAAIGQNVIDTQKPFLTAMFDVTAKFNPFGTARREITRSGTDTDNAENTATKTNTGTRTTTNAGTVTTAGTSKDTPNTTTATTKSAYNATATKPAESVTNSGTIDSVTSGTTTNDLTDTTTDNLTESNSATSNNSRSYNDKTTEISVSGAAETEAAFRKYIQPYDYLAREIVNAICSGVWEND